MIVPVAVGLIWRRGERTTVGMAPVAGDVPAPLTRQDWLALATFELAAYVDPRER